MEPTSTTAPEPTVDADVLSVVANSVNDRTEWTIKLNPPSVDPDQKQSAAVELRAEAGVLGDATVEGEGWTVDRDASTPTKLVLRFDAILGGEVLEVKVMGRTATNNTGTDVAVAVVDSENMGLENTQLQATTAESPSDEAAPNELALTGPSQTRLALVLGLSALATGFALIASSRARRKLP